MYEERSTAPPANDTIVVEQWTVIEVCVCVCLCVFTCILSSTADLSLMYVSILCLHSGHQCENRLRASASHSGRVRVAADVRAADPHHPSRQVDIKAPPTAQRRRSNG